MTLSQDALDSARVAYDSAWLSTHGSHAKSIAAAIEAYLKALPDAPTPPRAPAAETAEREAERRYPLPSAGHDTLYKMHKGARIGFLAGWQARELSALSGSEREDVLRVLEPFVRQEVETMLSLEELDLDRDHFVAVRDLAARLRSPRPQTGEENSGGEADGVSVSREWLITLRENLSEENFSDERAEIQRLLSPPTKKE
jgi:hypothetical protein